MQEGLNLLVLDNATYDISTHKNSLPHGEHWQVLLTSRQVIGAFELMALDKLSEEAARELFLEHCDKPQEEQALADFLEQLEYHTLSIELFAKILDSHWRLNTVEELGQFLDQQKIDDELLQTVVEVEHAGGETQLYRHLLSAFDLSGVAGRPEQLLVLQRMAALPPAAEGYSAQDLVEWLGEEENPTAFVNHLHELHKLGWLAQPQKNSFALHRLIRTVVEKAHPTDPAQLSPLVETFSQKLSIDQTKDNPIHKFPWIPFGRGLLDRLGEAAVAGKSELQNNLALVLQALGDYAGAKELLEKAMRSDEQNFGPEHPTTAVSYSNLARSFRT